MSAALTQPRGERLAAAGSPVSRPFGGGTTLVRSDEQGGIRLVRFDVLPLSARSGQS